MKNIIKFIAIDFDGVLTDNKVYIDEKGKETVKCNRSDGLAIQFLKKLNYKVFIISTEKNNVISQRSKKLGIKYYKGINDKEKKLLQLDKNKKIDLKKTLFIGNDINDFKAMKICFYKCCPNDSNKEIKKISNVVMKKNGGQGILFELLENVLKIDLKKII